MSEQAKVAKRNISNAEYEQALKNADNVSIIKYVTHKYWNQLDKDVIKSCGQVALWKALREHQESFGQKFTTSLVRFLHWECRTALRNEHGRTPSRRPKFEPLGDQDFPIRSEEDDHADDRDHLRHCIGELPHTQQWVMKMFFEDGVKVKQIATISGMGKEAIRNELNRGLQILCAMSRSKMPHPV